MRLTRRSLFQNLAGAAAARFLPLEKPAAPEGTVTALLPALGGAAAAGAVEDLPTDEITRAAPNPQFQTGWPTVALEFAIAGGCFYALSRVLADLRVNETLTLRREPQNRYDRFAIAVFRRDGTKLGYVPRQANQTLARLMDAGWQTDSVIVGFLDIARSDAALREIAFTATAAGEPRVRVRVDDG